MKFLLFVAACLICSSVPAFANSTGNEVLTRCQEAVASADNNEGLPTNDIYAGWCAGWVQAAIELTGLNEGWHEFTGAKNGLMDFCTPEGVTTAQGIRIVVKYLRDHPEHLNEDGMALTVASLRAAFPCKK